jgi:hypothetical protein
VTFRRPLGYRGSQELMTECRLIQLGSIQNDVLCYKKAGLLSYKNKSQNNLNPTSSSITNIPTHKKTKLSNE